MKVKQLKNNGLVVGVLSEKNLSIVDGKVKDEKGNNTIPAKIARGEIVLSTSNGDIKMRVYSQSKKRNGEDNPMYKGIETIATTNVSKVEATLGYLSYKTGDASNKDSELQLTKIKLDEGTVADTLSCNVQIGLNDYKAKDGKVKTSVQLSFNRGERITDDSIELTSDFEMEGVIRSIMPEIIKEEETERKIVEFVNIDYSGNAFPFKLVVPEDLASDFESFYEVGNTCKLNGSIIIKHVGGDTNTSSNGFGRKAHVQSGFDIMELQVIGGDPAYEEEVDKDGDLKAIEMSTMKKLMEERKIKLEALEMAENKANNVTKPSGGLGSKPKLSNEDMEEIPF